jgi:hypothetical protein
MMSRAAFGYSLSTKPANYPTNYQPLFHDSATPRCYYALIMSKRFFSFRFFMDAAGAVFLAREVRSA